MAEQNHKHSAADRARDALDQLLNWVSREHEDDWNSLTTPDVVVTGLKVLMDLPQAAAPNPSALAEGEAGEGEGE